MISKNHLQIHLKTNGGKMKRIIVSCIILLFLGTSAQASRYDDLVQHIKTKMGCTDEQANAFMHHVDNFAGEVQTIFSSVASHKVSDQKKQSLIQETIQKHFEKPTSSIQVSSLNYNNIKTYPVNQYLIHLSELSKQVYTSVKLYFKPDYLSMGTIYPYEDPAYGPSFEFKIGVWQIFEGWGDDNRPLYIDATQKDLILIFHKMENSQYWTLKIKSIVAKETITLDEFKQKWR